MAPEFTVTIKTFDVPVNLVETGYMHALLWDRAKDGDTTARTLYLKIKAAAIALGVDWYYGDPWDVTGDKGNG